MKPGIALLTTFVLLLVLGCTSTSSAPAQTPSPTSIPASPTPSPTATAVPPTPTPTATPSPEPTPTFEPDPVILPTPVVPTPEPTVVTVVVDPFQGEFDEIDSEVNFLRGLFSVSEIDRTFITRDELAVRLDADLEEGRDEIEQTGRLLKTLGLLEPEVDFFELVLNMFSEGVLGFFDPEEDALFIVEDKPGLDPLDKMVYAHEFVHGLQQQHFDIRALLDSVEGNSDAERAARGLIEGDATLAESIYLFNYMDEQARQEAIEGGGAFDLEAFFSAPRVFQRLFIFPYLQGAEFVVSLYGSEGWAAVDAAYARPPSSTEQILHPEKFAAGEEPIPVSVPDVSELLGERWSEIGQDTVGEFFIRVYLETASTAGMALEAASGWGGDRYSLLAGADGESLLIWTITWDTEEDAVEFYDTFQLFMQVFTGGVWAPGEGDRVSVLTLSSQIVRASLDKRDTLLVFAPDASTLDAVLAAFAP